MGEQIFNNLLLTSMRLERLDHVIDVLICEIEKWLVKIYNVQSCDNHVPFVLGLSGIIERLDW